MSDFAKEVLPINLEDEMRRSYLDYAMSVIVGRALPDVRDGLKPVHRRVLYAMRELGNDFNKPYKKSARIVGDVIGKYHPHGDSAVYDTIVRMAQDFSLRYMLVDGQGNFGSVDGDSAAAMRYTEVRMSKLAHELLADIDKNTVNFIPNYDETESEPEVLPTRVPNLLVNGSAGIAVGMATNIPPHNLGEVVDALLYLQAHPQASIDELMECLPAPDFPTGAIINGTSGIVQAYRTGRGRVKLRARTEIEEHANGRESIVVTELPYQVNKAKLVKDIATLAKDKKIEGISEIRDESDKDGYRVVVDLKRGENAEVVLNNLFQQTQMQTVFGINMVALDRGQPRQMNLKDMLAAFLMHRREVVTRRTRFLLAKARDRAHVLEGLTVALANIDPIIALIKRSPSPAEAKAALCAQRWAPGSVMDLIERARAQAEDNDQERITDEGYLLSEVQAQAILDLRLHRLTGLEQDKIKEEFNELLDQIGEYLDILTRRERLLEVIHEELVELKEAFNDPRRSEITAAVDDFEDEDLIPPQDMVVTMSHKGYVKAQPLDVYQAQRRGGVGRSAAKTRDEDFVDKFWVTHTHHWLLCFSSLGKVYWLRVFRLPTGGRDSKGRPIVNLLPLADDERITQVLPVKDFDAGDFVVMCTRLGTIKKVPLEQFSRPRSVGLIALDLRVDDELVSVDLTNGDRNIMLFTHEGRVVRFHEGAVRAMGRTAFGVRGIKLADGDRVISLVVDHGEPILTVSENGYGKRTPIDDYPLKSRGTMGVLSMKRTERTGKVVAAIPVEDGDHVMLIAAAGQLVRTEVSQISTLSRNTQGVRLINLRDTHLVAVDRIRAELITEDDQAAAEAPVDTATDTEQTPDKDEDA